MKLEDQILKFLGKQTLDYDNLILSKNNLDNLKKEYGLSIKLEVKKFHTCYGILNLIEYEKLNDSEIIFFNSTNNKILKIK